MIEFKLSVGALGNTTFGYSPLAEVASSLRLLGRPRPGFLMQPWLAEVSDNLGAVDLEFLRAVAPPGKWAPDFLFRWSADPKITVEHQLDALAGLSTDQIRRDLGCCWTDRGMPAVLNSLLTSRNAAPRIADAIWEYWQAVVAPYWPRIKAVLDDDVSHRGGRALTQGLLSVFEDLHPEISVRDTTIRVDKPHHADYEYEGARITLVPSVFTYPELIVLDETDQSFGLIYGARGIGRVWEGLDEHNLEDSDLGALIGRNRATILRRLEIPMTTTELADELGQSPGTVNQHLSVLKRNGFLDSWRSGRRVLYRRTALASSVIAAGDHQQSAAEILRRPGAS